jgi:hypothetical protein
LVAQIRPEQPYDHRLADRVIVYLQTKDARLFPFAARFDEERRLAFIRDLREALADLQDSGSARKTSATGKIMNDRRLQETINEWAAADGDWPRGADPRDPFTALGADWSGGDTTLQPGEPLAPPWPPEREPVGQRR